MHSRNGSLKYRPQLPPTMPWGLTPSPDYSGLGPGTNLIRVIVSHGYGVLAKALCASRPTCSDHTKNCRGQRVASVVKCSRACIGVSKAPCSPPNLSRGTQFLRSAVPAATLIRGRTPRDAPLRRPHCAAALRANSHTQGAQLPAPHTLMSRAETAAISHLVGSRARLAGSLATPTATHSLI